MRTPNTELSTDSMEREGRLARAQTNLCSNSNPYVMLGPAPLATLAAVEAWLWACTAWWRGWDLEDARQAEARRQEPSSLDSVSYQVTGPEKSALLRSLGTREPDLRKLALSQYRRSRNDPATRASSAGHSVTSASAASARPKASAPSKPTAVKPIIR
jgi:hypothetical protein